MLECHGRIYRHSIKKWQPKCKWVNSQLCLPRHSRLLMNPVRKLRAIKRHVPLLNTVIHSALYANCLNYTHGVLILKGD